MKSLVLLCILFSTIFSCTEKTDENGESNIVAGTSYTAETVLPDTLRLDEYYTAFLYGNTFHGVFEYKHTNPENQTPFQYIEIETSAQNNVRHTNYTMYDHYLKPSNTYKEKVQHHVVQITTYTIFEPGQGGVLVPAIADSLVATTNKLAFSTSDTMLISFRFDSPSQPDFYVKFSDKTWCKSLKKERWKSKETDVLVMHGNFMFSYNQKNFTYNNEMNCKKIYHYAKRIGLIYYSYTCSNGSDESYSFNRILSPAEFAEMQLNPPLPPEIEPDTTPIDYFVPMNK